jgi:hypothetical protein
MPSRDESRLQSFKATFVPKPGAAPTVSAAEVSAARARTKRLVARLANTEVHAAGAKPAADRQRRPEGFKPK